MTPRRESSVRMTRPSLKGPDKSHQTPIIYSLPIGGREESRGVKVPPSDNAVVLKVLQGWRPASADSVWYSQSVPRLPLLVIHPDGTDGLSGDDGPRDHELE
jgi:hypothetical protein